MDDFLMDTPHGEGGALGKSSRPPENEKDTLYGRGVANAVTVIGEGLMEGFPTQTIWNGKIVTTVDARHHIYLNNQLIKYPGQTVANVKRVKVPYRPGSATQTPIKGFTTTTAFDTQVGIVIKKNGGAVTRSFVNAQVDVIRVNVAVRMFKQDKNIQGTELQFEIWTQRNTEGFKKKKVITLKEQATEYSPISYDIPTNNQNGTAANWSVRIVKITPDGDNTKVVNDLQWLSYGQIVETKLSYAHTSILAMQLDSETFSSFPDATVNQHGIKNLLIPAGVTIRNDRTLNYGSVTWTGATTTSPVALNCLFPTLINELTNPRINRFPLRLDQIDLSDLFEIDRWNNALITHQDGVQRPRFKLRFYLDGLRSGFDVLDDLCSACFANYYWADGKLRFWQNRTGLPKTQQFDNASVVDGVFDYPETPIDTRYNVCRVTWWDPKTAEEDEEYYEDSADVAINGYKEAPAMVALGCENRWQAYLYAKAVVKTSLLEFRYCNFTATARGAFCRPGQILTIYDENTAQVRNAGLLRAWNGSTTFTLDLATVANIGETFRFMGTDGSIQSLTIASAVNSSTVITTAAPSVTPLIEGTWAIAGSIVGAEYRVENVEIDEEDPDKVNITCINNVPNLWDVIENDAEPLILKVRGLAPPDVFPVKNLSAALLEVDVSGFDLNPDLYTLWSDWTEPTIGDNPNPYIQSYFAEFRVLPDGEWIQRQVIAKETTEARWAGLALGRYQTRVAAVDIYGRVGEWVLSPEVLTTTTGSVDATGFNNRPSRVILVIRCQNLSNCSIKIQNTGSVAIVAYGIFMKTHSYINYLQPNGLINVGGALFTDAYEAAVVSDISNSQNAAVQNNLRLPVIMTQNIFGSTGGTINPGQWQHLNVNCAGFQEIYVLARTTSGTTTAKIFYSGKPLSFDHY